MANQLAKYNMGGISFFIPCNPTAECEFLKDVVPVNQQEDEDNFQSQIDEALQAITSLASDIDHEAEQHDDYYNRMHAFDELNHIPETYK